MPGGPPPSTKAEAAECAARLLRRAGTPAVLRLLVDRTLCCFAWLGDWRGLGEWLRAVQGLHAWLTHDDGGEGGGEAEAEEGGDTQVPAWLAGALQPRGDPAVLQAWMRIDTQAMGARSPRRPSLPPPELSEALALLHPAPPLHGSWAAHHAAQAERGLAGPLDDVLAALAGAADRSHADRLRALEVQAPRILEGLASAAGPAPTATPEEPPSPHALADVACMQVLASALRAARPEGQGQGVGGEGEGAALLAQQQQGRAPHAAFVGLMEEAPRVAGADARAWANVARTQAAVGALAALQGGLGAGAGAGPAGVEIKMAWARDARKDGNVRLARDLLRLVGHRRDGEGAPPPLWPELEVRRR
jgi:hypothetical protein